MAAICLQLLLSHEIMSCTEQAINAPDVKSVPQLGEHQQLPDGVRVRLATAPTTADLEGASAARLLAGVGWRSCGALQAVAMVLTGGSGLEGSFRRRCRELNCCN
jgi:hypothetical protein